MDDVKSVSYEGEGRFFYENLKKILLKGVILSDSICTLVIMPFFLGVSF